MIKFLFFILSFSMPLIGHAGYMIKENESCKTTITKLTIYTKNDFNLVSKSCDSEENPSIENFIASKNNKQFLNKYSMDGGSWPQELAAVSIYKAKKPVLITLHTQKWCCYPSPEGVVYSVDLYNIIKLNDGFKIMPITQILGDNSSGLNGTSDEVMHFKLKDISSIKKWLDKNYK